MISDNANILPYYPSLELLDYRKGYSYGKVMPLIVPLSKIPAFQWAVAKGYNTTSFKIVNFNTGQENEVLNEVTVNGGFEAITTHDDYDILKYPSAANIASFFPKDGVYYLKLSDGVTEYFSEIFNMCDGDKTIKIEYWNNSNFAYNGGHFDYENGYRHFMYSNSEIAKPEYRFTQNATKRQGLNYPINQASWKEYKFTMLVTEYLVDAMRYIRLHDNVEIIHNQVRFEVDEFNTEVLEWLEFGQIALIECTIRTGTITNINGRGIIK